MGMRLLVESELLDEVSPTLPPDAAKHLRVLRVKAGEAVELFDGKGAYRKYEVQFADTKAPRLCAVGERQVQPRGVSSLVLFACVTKGSRWDWTIEKATELGATKIVPVISSRTIVRLSSSERAAKRERWQRIAEEAARQSDAKWIPEIVEAMDFEATLQLVKATNTFIGALTEPPPQMIVDALMATKDKTNLAVYVGPEGDFSPEELTALMKVATPVSFGSMILRAETAAIFALSVLSAFKEAK